MKKIIEKLLGLDKIRKEFEDELKAEIGRAHV